MSQRVHYFGLNSGQYYKAHTIVVYVSRVVNIDTVSNLELFWSRQVNKFEPRHIVYIMQQ